MEIRVGSKRFEGEYRKMKVVVCQIEWKRMVSAGRCM